MKHAFMNACGTHTIILRTIIYCFTVLIVMTRYQMIYDHAQTPPSALLLFLPIRLKFCGWMCVYPITKQISDIKLCTPNAIMVAILMMMMMKMTRKIIVYQYSYHNKLGRHVEGIKYMCEFVLNFTNTFFCFCSHSRRTACIMQQ